MKIANISVDRPIAVSMLIVTLIMVGLVSLPRLRVDLYPDMNLPYVMIMANYEGASPAEVENLVTKPLESAVSTVNNVKEVISFSEPGMSMVLISLDWGTNTDMVSMDIRDKTDMIRDYLPSEVKDPQLFKMDPNSMPIMSFTLSGSDLSELKRVAEDVVQPRLERVEGVASVYVSGGREKEIKVVLDKSRLQSYSLTPGQVAQAIGGDNLAGTAGSTVRGKNDLDIRVIGEYRTTGDLANLSISLPAGGSVRLGDIAEVREDYKKITQISYVNGNPCVGLDIMKESGGNTVQVASRVNGEIEKLQSELPREMRLVTVLDSSKYIRDTINSLVEHAVLGGLLAVAVLYLFLRSFRSTIVVALVMPISIIATFSMMYFGKQTINLLSMGGLALGIGSLVDFSVVVMESIFRYRSDGHGVIEAAKLGTAEVGNAVMASAATQIVVFLPIVFVQGLAGILFGPLALTVSFSHAAALFAALTLVPMITSRMLKITIADREENGHDVLSSAGRFIDLLHMPADRFGRSYRRFTRMYSRVLDWALGHRKSVIAISATAFAASCYLLTMVGTEFIPNMDEGQISITIDLPSGAQLEETGRIVDRVEEIASGIEASEIIFSRVGVGGMFAMMGTGTPDKASMQIKLKPMAERTMSTEEAVEKLRGELNDIPGAEFTVQVADQMMGGSFGAPISVMVAGDDLEVLKELGAIIAQEVKSVPGTRNVKSSMEKAKPELQVAVDRLRAGQYGVTAGQVLSAVKTAFNGQVVSRLRTGQDEIDIRLMYPEDYRQDINNLANTMITSMTGAQVAVGDVATISVQQAPVTITRYKQARYISVDTEIFGRDLGSVNREIEAKMKNVRLPAGYTMDVRGQTKDMQESFGDLSIAILLAVLLVYMVMAAQFESLFYPFVIMFSIPPTIIGVALGLFLTGFNISVTGLIGYIMLVGIVVNNAIVLIDYVNTLRKRGLTRDDAIRKAGPVRLRPILMTTLSTVLALIPLAFGQGEGAAARAPLAVVVSFGLTFSTIVTLLLVPVVYTMFDDFGRWLKGIFGSLLRIGGKESGTAAGN